MFGFFRVSRRVKKEEENTEEKILAGLRESLGDEPPTTTILKNRLRIIDLEDKIIFFEKQLKELKKLMAGYFNRSENKQKKSKSKSTLKKTEKKEKNGN